MCLCFGCGGVGGVEGEWAGEGPEGVQLLSAQPPPPTNCGGVQQPFLCRPVDGI